MRTRRKLANAVLLALLLAATIATVDIDAGGTQVVSKMAAGR